MPPKVNNFQLGRKISNIIKGIVTTLDLNETIQPVIDVTPLDRKYVSANTAFTDTQTLYTVPAGKRLYIMSVGLSMIGGAAIGSGYLHANLSGTASGLIYINLNAVTQQVVHSQVYPEPLVVEAGKTVGLYWTGTAPTDGKQWMIGYLEDVV